MKKVRLSIFLGTAVLSAALTMFFQNFTPASAASSTSDVSCESSQNPKWVAIVKLKGASAGERLQGAIMNETDGSVLVDFNDIRLPHTHGECSFSASNNEIKLCLDRDELDYYLIKLDHAGAKSMHPKINYRLMKSEGCENRPQIVELHLSNHTDPTPNL